MKSSSSGFSLVELVIVVAIVAVLAQMVQVAWHAVEKSRVGVAMATQDRLRKAIFQYYLDVGFFPPDTNRGWDPGLARALPYNLDQGKDCATTLGDCPVCSGCPVNWRTIVLSSWRGPYLKHWPEVTPWSGEYDYNNWPSAADRYGCIVPAGIYAGVQGDYANSNTIPLEAEKIMLSKNYDADGCVNGEAELSLAPPQ